MRSKRLYLGFLLWMFGAVAVVLPFGVAAGGDATCSGPPPVLVPASLDGVAYNAAEFNTIHRELYCRGIATYSIATPNGLQVFTTVERHNDYAKRVGVGPLLDKEQMEQMVGAHPVKVVGERGGDILVVPDGPDSPGLQAPEVMPLAACPPLWSYTRNCEYTWCGGSVFTLAPNSGVANLGNYGWNDAISSVMIPANISYERLWDNVGFSGSTLTLRPVYGATTYGNLGNFGWNDRASSIYNCQLGC